MVKENIVVLSIGSNIGDRKNNLREAILELERVFDCNVKSSSIYQTEPWGFDSNNLFLNCCVSFSTNLAPHRVLELTQLIELKLGRVKKSKNNFYESRVIDLDILYYNDLILDTERLKIPHPLIYDRLFVVKPLAELLPVFIDPLKGVTTKHLLMICNVENKVVLYED
ncbi:2-amino-4-hydroxy-6-hydroxymethyldihydropteridine diphosphokinase [Brumimicrobium mesophilum]|uniref:2-amino-4-hydroxy-6- hydroxymethyldihydropteridine diphosphokinase n=1 Tax=Brumimicrobium mesophilum TaxID=392717 RepID=UPI000D1449A2|nr:2-amino-4-hydroxy-6-hydroxymethyldihydropteridine diphosphokinase [Brumimicrobium mesophilum]